MDRQYYKEYYTLERTHWWFRARQKIIQTIIEKHVTAGGEKLKILNIGAATGATTELLQKYGEVTSLEYDEECCRFLNNTLKIETIHASMTDLPFADDQFDLVCAFDVIEHIEDDSKAVSELKRVTKKNRFFFITVPAFNFLWSRHDDINRHERRYTHKMLMDLLNKHKLKIKFSSYFNFWLFLPIALVRLPQKLIKTGKPQKDGDSSGSDFEGMNSSGFLNKMLYRLFLSEKTFLKNKITLPFGVSLLCIGIKKD